jgi:hypothetical protein
MHKAGERADAPKQIAERFVAFHRFDERAARVGTVRQRREFALVRLLEGKAVGVGAIEVALDGGIVDAGVEVGQVPFRK